MMCFCDIWINELSNYWFLIWKDCILLMRLASCRMLKMSPQFFLSEMIYKKWNNRFSQCCTFVCFPGNHMSDKESVEELPSHITKDLPHTMTQHKHLQLLLQQRYLNQATNSEPKPHRYAEPAASSNNVPQVGPDRMVSLHTASMFWRVYLLL